MENNHYDLIIVGGGPAGLAAGIYSSRAKLRTLILNEGTTGGQLVLTHEIANYPGIESISGYALGRNMARQAENFGCVIKSNVKITGYCLQEQIKTIEVEGGKNYTADAIILSPGGRSRTLGVPGEEILKGKGISYCATCDGDFFQDKNIMVVGGGNSALEEAVSLTKYANSVTIVHQFDHFQAFPYAIEEARRNDKVSFIMESSIIEFIGDERLKAVKIENQKTGKVRSHSIDGVFVFIGYEANTQDLHNKVRLNDRGEILVNADLETNVKGVFAAGDCIVKKVRQVTTAVADGTIAALSAADYIHHQAHQLLEDISR